MASQPYSPTQGRKVHGVVHSWLCQRKSHLVYLKPIIDVAGVVLAETGIRNAADDTEAPDLPLSMPQGPQDARGMPSLRLPFRLRKPEITFSM